MLEITCTIRYAYTATCLCMDFFFLLDISWLLEFQRLHSFRILE